MHEYNLKINNKRFNVQVFNVSDNAAELKVNGQEYSVEYDNPGTPITKEGAPFISLPKISIPQKEFAAKPLFQSLATPIPLNQPDNGNAKEVTAPIPGSISEIKINLNQPVKKGQILIIMEAMKMENEICSDIDGIIESIEVLAGDSVQQGQCLIRIG